MYIVVEVQTDAEGHVSIPPVASYETINEAEGAFHSVLAAAAVSSVPIHSAIVINEKAELIRSEHYEH